MPCLCPSKRLMDSVLSLAMGQVSVVMVFKASWLFSVNLMAVILSSSQLAVTLSPLWLLLPLACQCPFFPKGLNILIPLFWHHVYLSAFLPLFPYSCPYCFLLQPSRITSRRSINHNGNHWVPAGEMSMGVVGERQKAQKPS